MKKYIITAVITFGVMFGLQAQNDGFFNFSDYDREERSIVSSHRRNSDDNNAAPAPVGSGILLLAGLGLGYVVLSKRKQ